MRFDRLACALQRAHKSLGTKRFKEIVDRFELERGDGVLVMSGREDDGRRRPGLAQALQDLDSREFRNLDIEEHDVGMQSSYRFDCGCAVARLTDLIRPGNVVDQRCEPAASERLIIDDEYLHVT